MAGIGTGGRALAGLIAAAVLGALLTGAALEPRSEGHGTHTQLGLPGCGWAAAFGRPCVTCGMTTAVAHAAHGNPTAAFAAQPLGAALAYAAAAGFWAALHATATGSRVGLALGGLARPRYLWVLAAAAAAAWGYKLAVWPVANAGPTPPAAEIRNP